MPQASTLEHEYEITIAGLGVAAFAGGSACLGYGLLAELIPGEEKKDANSIARLALGGAALCAGVHLVLPAGVRQLWTAFR